MARRRESLDMPRIDMFDGLTKVKLRDEHNKRYSIRGEFRWINLPVEKSSSDGYGALYAFADTYQGISQLNESRRPQISKHYFGGKVGQKISVYQLQDTGPRNFDVVLNTARMWGLTTMREFEIAEEEGEEEELIGRTRHTLLNQVSIQPHQIDLFEQTLNKKPLFVSFVGNREQMQIIGEENTLFRRYSTDEDGEESLAQHSVMCIGRGYGINDDDKTDIVSYVVGQNNWPTGSAEICRFSYKSLKLAVGFDVGSST